MPLLARLVVILVSQSKLSKCQMTAIIGRIRFVQRQAKFSLASIGPTDSYSCAVRLALSPAQ